MPNESLNILKTTVKIGLDAPVRFLHITDSHISLADECDSERLKRLAAARRANCFETGREDGVTVRLYEKAIDYARKNELFVVCTGDLIDFMSHANFAYLDHAFDGVDYVYALGNHDICAYVGGDKEDEAYKWNNMKLTAPHIRSNLYFDSKLYGGVNFVTLDNSYYLISPRGSRQRLSDCTVRAYAVLYAGVCRRPSGGRKGLHLSDGAAGGAFGALCAGTPCAAGSRPSNARSGGVYPA